MTLHFKIRSFLSAGSSSPQNTLDLQFKAWNHLMELGKSLCQEENAVPIVSWYFSSDSRDCMIGYCGQEYDR